MLSYTQKEKEKQREREKHSGSSNTKGNADLIQCLTSNKSNKFINLKNKEMPNKITSFFLILPLLIVEKQWGRTQNYIFSSQHFCDSIFSYLLKHKEIEKIASLLWSLVWISSDLLENKWFSADIFLIWSLRNKSSIFYLLFWCALLSCDIICSALLTCSNFLEHDRNLWILTNVINKIMSTCNLSKLHNQ